jgi:hypothetical protein
MWYPQTSKIQLTYFFQARHPTPIGVKYPVKVELNCVAFSKSKFSFNIAWFYIFEHYVGILSFENDV